MKTTVCFTLDSDRDRHILRWLDGLPRGDKSAAIRDALDAHLGRAGVTLGDVYQAVKALERKLGSGYVAASAGTAAQTDEPPDVALNLDELGL